MLRGILLVILLFAASCQSSIPVNNDENTDSAENAKSLKSLFDTTPEPLRNTDHFHSVEIKQMQFLPAELKVHKGDTIAWINNDIVVHDITEEKKKEWSSSPMSVGSTWQKVIEKNTDYFCSIHVMMKGKIIVE